MFTQLRKWGLYSNLHISIAALGILLSSYTLTGVPPDYGYLLLATSGALLVYHADRAFFKASEDLANAPDRLIWYDEHRVYLLFSTLVAGAGVIWGAFLVESNVLLWGAAIGVVGLLYAAPLPFSSKRIKDFAIIKTLLIVTCWVIGGVILPTNEGTLTSELVLIATFKGLYIFPIVLMAEWVDRSGDEKHGFVTFGARLTLPKIKVISVLGLIVSVLLLWRWSFVFARLDVLVVDFLGMLGMLIMLFHNASWNGERIIWLDLWVGFGIVTWAFSVMT